MEGLMLRYGNKHRNGQREDSDADIIEMGAIILFLAWNLYFILRLS